MIMEDHARPGANIKIFVLKFACPAVERVLVEFKPAYANHASSSMLVDLAVVSEDVKKNRSRTLIMRESPSPKNSRPRVLRESLSLNPEHVLYSNVTIMQGYRHFGDG